MQLTPLVAGCPGRSSTSKNGVPLALPVSGPSTSQNSVPSGSIRRPAGLWKAIDLLDVQKHWQSQWHPDGNTRSVQQCLAVDFQPAIP